MSPWLRKKLRRLLPTYRARQQATFHLHTELAFLASVSLRLFYALHLFLLVGVLRQWSSLRSQDTEFLLWPVKWMGSHVNPYEVDALIFTYCLSVGLACIAPSFRTARLLLFLSFLQLLAFQNSFGKIGHSMHCYVYVSFFLCLLPKRCFDDFSTSRAARHTVLTIWTYAKASVLITYFLAGFWKFLFAFGQLSVGQRNAFSVDGMSALIAARLLEDNTTSFFGPFLIEHHQISRSLLVGGMTLELIAIAPIFLFRHHHLLGLTLVLFHLSSTLILGIGFDQQVLLVAVMFFVYPAMSRRAVINQNGQQGPQDC